MLGKSVWFALCAVWLCAAASARADGARRSTFIDGGTRWLGAAPTCHAQAPWTARPLFRTASLPVDLKRICLYSWTQAGADPSQSDIAALAGSSGASELTEDVAVVLASAAFSAEEVAFLGGLRSALRAQVGDVGLLPPLAKQTPSARIVVIDSAPDALHGHIVLGTSRHGDTLAHLIEDLVCLPGKADRRCAAEVTAALALDGGAGTLSDLAGAIERAVSTWLTGRITAPASTPPQLILNLSLGWEHHPVIADCSEDPEGAGLPAHAVLGILQYAAAQGALIVAAAGNDSGGPQPRTGLVCPGRFQAIPRIGDPKQSLVVAVSGVDYQDHPLTSARPLGITGIAGLGLGGVAWSPGDPVPPPLTGSSVSTAVVSAISALVWARRPAWSSAQVTQAVYTGGGDVGPADHCPLAMAGCRSHRASVCGALNAAGAALACAPPAPRSGSSPALPAEITALTAAFASLPASAGVAAVTAAPLPHDTVPTLQITPWLYPMPIAETCPVCCVAQGQLVLPAHDDDLEDPVLVVHYADGSTQSVALAPVAAPFGAVTLDGGTPYSFALPAPPTASAAVAAYLTAIIAPPAHPAYSITEQIFIQP